MLYNVFIKISSQNTSKGCDASNICSFRDVRLLAPLAEISTMPVDDLDGYKTLRLDHATPNTNTWIQAGDDYYTVHNVRLGLRI